MIPKNWISRKLGYALSIWAGCLSMIIGFIAGRTPSAIFVRSAIAFILFGILGYIAGWVIHRVMQPKLAFIDEADEEDNEDGEAMEGV